MACGHSLLIPDLVVRASVVEATLTNTTQGFTLSYGQGYSPHPHSSRLFQKPCPVQESQARESEPIPVFLPAPQYITSNFNFVGNRKLLEI